MTTYTISSHTLNGSETWGPYTADSGSAWIKVAINTPAHADPDYQRMFLEPVTVLIERSANGTDWEHYGSHVIHGDDFHYPESTPFDRDSFDPAQYWVSIQEDGFQYRVTVTTTYSQIISGSVEFDTVSDRISLSTGSGIEITDFTVVQIYGPGGHGTGPRSRFTTPLLDVGSDNPAIVVINPEQHPLWLYGTEQSCSNNYPNASTGDFKKIYWGLDGIEIPLISRAGRDCYVQTPIHVKTGIKNDRDYVHVEYENTYPDGWLDEGTPPEEREIAYVPAFTCAVLVLKNVDQADPIFDTWESHATNSLPNDGAVPYDGTPMGWTTTKTTIPGQFIVNSTIMLAVVDSASDPYTEPVSGATSIFETYDAWAQDEWAFGASFRIADSTSTTVGHLTGWTDGSTVSNPYTASNAVILSETSYCHYVAVPTPADPADRPDANQIRAGTDGFDAAALDAQVRGPDADGTVRFDPFSDASIEPGTDITLCYVWEDESQAVYYDLTTAGAIYYVAVETPVDDNDLPDADQIKAGTDGFDVAALDIQVATLPGSSGTVTFNPFTGADPGTDYTLCFVYFSDATTHEAPLYYDLTTAEVNVGTASGTSTVSGIGVALVSAIASASGIGSASAVSQAIREAVASASGVATVSGVGASTFESVGTAAGTSSADAVGSYDGGLQYAVGSAAGTSASDAVGAKEVRAVGTSSGTSDAQGVPQSRARGGRSKAQKKKGDPEYLKRIMEPASEPIKIPDVKIPKAPKETIVPFQVPPSAPEPVVIRKEETVSDLISQLKETLRMQNEKIEALTKLVEAKDQEIERLFEQLKEDMYEEVVSLVVTLH